MPEKPAPTTPPLWDALIIGAGFAGLGMAAALQRTSARYLVLEKAAAVGGVWRDNTYPGAACDVPSHLYSFSFAPNPNWSRTFATQPEIAQYLEDIADKCGLRPNIRCNTQVQSASFHAPTSHWHVTLTNGSILHTKMLITAMGQLSRPSIPNLPGAQNLKIPAFHSARWDHTLSLAGKRIAVIGTGASAIQFIPEIAKTAAHISIFQRSAAYVIPRADRAYTASEKARFARHPLLMRLHRTRIYLIYESRALAFTRFKSIMDVSLAKPFKKLLAQQVKSPDLRAKLTPGYPPGCKRILLSNDYLATMAQPNVELVTAPIQTLTENAVQTQDGRLHQVDCLIYGTGFAATEFLTPLQITGINGQTLSTIWQNGATAYMGTAVPGFPNFFMLYGPNTNLGHNSIIFMLESQIAHIMRIFKTMSRKQAKQVQVTQHAYQNWDRHTQMRLAKTVWNGCKSWYITESGRNTTNWPGFTLTYRFLCQHAPLTAYNFTP